MKAQELVQLVKDKDTDGVLAALDDEPELANALSPENDRPLLHLAALYGNATVVDRLIEMGVEPDHRDSAGKTALMHAGSREVVDLLLARGADPQARDAQGNTALHGAFVPEVVEALLGHGLDPNARNAEQKTPLLKCLGADIARILLEHGADPNAQDKDGQTGTYWVLFTLAGGPDREQLSEVVSMFVQHGADLNVRDKNGRTMLDMFAFIASPRDTLRQHSEIADGFRALCHILVEHGAEIPPQAKQQAKQQPGQQTAGGSGCFIATACYGSAAHPQVLALRAFRDDVLEHNVVGRLAIGLYYRLSPSVAAWIARSERRRSLARRFVVAPVAAWIRKIW